MPEKSVADPKNVTVIMPNIAMLVSGYFIEYACKSPIYRFFMLLSIYT